MNHNILEASPDTLIGSFTPDLVLSKLWLIREVSQLHRNFDTIYILGSWYGNLSILLFKQHAITFKRIANVDLNSEKLKAGEYLAQKLGIDSKIVPMVKDANSLTYSMMQQPGLVINTSAGNMQNSGWFDNIPSGTLVAIQGRDPDPGAVYEFSSTDELTDMFLLSKVLYNGSLKLKDPETNYTRYMIIGLK
jgi:hypothetical protein